MHVNDHSARALHDDGVRSRARTSWRGVPGTTSG